MAPRQIDGHHLHLVHLVDLQEPVLHGLDRGGDRGHLVADGVVEVALDDPVDVAVEGGREEHGLVTALDLAQHPFDLGQESHVGHAVGLVEHDDLDLGQRDGASLGQVDQPSRRGDDHVDALVELLDLALDVGAAVDDDDAAPRRLAQGLEHVGHLDGELTGGHEHQGARAVGAAGAGPHEQGQAEGEGLARAGLGLAAHVAAGDAVGDGERLDRERCGDALRVQDRHQLGGHPQLFEGRGGNGFEARRARDRSSSSSAGPLEVMVIGGVARLSSLTAAHRPRGGPASMTPPRPLLCAAIEEPVRKTPMHAARRRGIRLQCSGQGSEQDVSAAAPGQAAGRTPAVPGASGVGRGPVDLRPRRRGTPPLWPACRARAPPRGTRPRRRRGRARRG